MIHCTKCDYRINAFKGTVWSKQFFAIFSKNRLSNKKSHKGLIPFSVFLASCFNWGAPCKREVSNMRFSFVIGAFLRLKTLTW